LETGQTTAAEVAEELGPELLGLTVTDHHVAEDLTVPVTSNAGSGHDGLGNHPAVDPGVAVGRAEKHVRERLLVQRSGAPGRDLGGELAADPGDV